MQICWSPQVIIVGSTVQVSPTLPEPEGTQAKSWPLFVAEQVLPAGQL